MKDNSMSGLVPGMLMGAALGMLGGWCLNSSPRQMRRTTKKLSRNAEKALNELEDMVCRCME